MADLSKSNQTKSKVLLAVINTVTSITKNTEKCRGLVGLNLPARQNMRRTQRLPAAVEEFSGKSYLDEDMNPFVGVNHIYLHYNNKNKQVQVSVLTLVVGQCSAATSSAWAGTTDTCHVPAAGSSDVFVLVGGWTERLLRHQNHQGSWDWYENTTIAIWVGFLLLLFNANTVKPINMYM